MVKVIVLSMIVSSAVSYGMMKLQMRMIEKWMDHFFEEETKYIKSYLSKDK